MTLILQQPKPETTTSSTRTSRTEPATRSTAEQTVIPLEVLIDGLAYGVEPATDERDGTQYGWYMESAKREDVYEVIPLAGMLSCTCNHFRFRLRGTGQQCRHIKAVREQLPNVCKRPRPAADQIDF